MPTEKKSASGLRAVFVDASNTLHMVAGASPSATIIPAKTGYTVHVQLIVVTITTDAAQTLTFRDTAGSPVLIALIAASPGVGQRRFDYGEQGVELTPDKGLDLVASAAGLAGSVNWEAYYRPTPGGAIVPSQV